MPHHDFFYPRDIQSKMKIVRYGWLALFTLFFLWLVVGFHFFGEGFDKILDPKPFSNRFFTAATGPYAEQFHAMAWDADGLLRLGYQANDETGFPQVNMKRTKEIWAEYSNEVSQHYRYDKEQKKQCDYVLGTYLVLLDDFVNGYRDVKGKFIPGYEAELIEYFQAIERRDNDRGDVVRQSVASLRGQARTWEGEILRKRAPLLRQVDAMWSSLETDLNGLANKKQAKRSRLAIGKIGRTKLDSVAIDRIIPWFDCTVGLLLILGLFTRVASLAGVVFLMGVLVTQWPGSVGAATTWPQLIEMLAMLTLAAVGAGQIGGLDYFVGSWFRSKKREENE
jgi:uncharacterized membrane protein YphA (DoxX/SURF4 family)